MKFKNGTITAKDKDGDRLTFETSISGDSALYARVNGGVGVRVTRGKALKLAYAILNELDPI